jgi:hypothetical protein
MSSDSAERAQRRVERIGRYLPIVAALVVLVTTAAESQISPVQQSRRAAAVTRFVHDGDGFAAVRLGENESVVRTLFGPPVSENTSGPERRLVYPLRGGVVLEVRTTSGTVAAIAITAGEGPTLHSPKTVRGVRLGAPIGQVLERYGAPAGDHHWYADEGIAFNIDGPAPIVQSILLFPRRTPPPN